MARKYRAVILEESVVKKLKKVGTTPNQAIKKILEDDYPQDRDLKDPYSQRFDPPEPN